MSEKSIAKLLNEEPANIPEIIEWVEIELKHWRLLSKILSQDSESSENKSIAEYTTLLAEIMAYHENNLPLDFRKLGRALDIINECHLPHHDDGIFDLFNPKTYAIQKTQEIILLYKVSRISLKSLVKEQYEIKYEQRINNAVAQLDSISNNYTDMHQKATATNEKSRRKLEDLRDTLISEITSQVQASANGEKTSISELSSSIQREIRSNEPVTFWERKEARHRSQARDCRRAAISLGACAIIALTLLIFAAFKDQDTTIILGFKIPNHFYIAVSIIIGSAFVWALKVSIQLMMTHIALEAEALEKSTAIKTYVALSGQIKDQEIDREFHKALLSFSKIKVAEDTNHPELLKLVEQFLSKKKDPS